MYMNRVLTSIYNFSKLSAHTPAPYTGRSLQDIYKDKNQYAFPLYTHYFKQPFLAVEGHRQFLYDQTGKEYIDMMGGISCMNIGHSHPRVTKIYQEMSSKLINLSSHYVNQYQGLFAQKLCNQLGNDLDTVFFFNSGSQANDFAYNLAKTYTKNNTVVALRNGYHGTAGQAYNLTSIGTWNTKLTKGNALQRLAWPNLKRSAHKSVDSLIKDAEQQLDSSTPGKIAGLWLQHVMGAGGIYPLPKDYVKKMHALTKKMGGLYISDQVQTGFGRIGKQTWGYKWQQVKPDIVVMAKAIANGSPFAAVVTRRQIGQSLNHNYFPTFAGGPIECRIGMEVLDIIKQQKLAENAENIGSYLKQQFQRIQKKSRFIFDVRGKGFMIAIQFVKDLQKNEPSGDNMAFVMEKARQLGVLYGRGGSKGNCVRVLGPICISKKSAQKAVWAFQQAIQALQAHHK